MWPAPVASVLGASADGAAGSIATTQAGLVVPGEVAPWSIDSAAPS